MNQSLRHTYLLHVTPSQNHSIVEPKSIYRYLVHYLFSLILLIKLHDISFLYLVSFSSYLAQNKVLVNTTEILRPEL
jgi:hypothetical protein